jgi:hypothetical protein
MDFRQAGSFITESAFDREGQLATPHVEVCERRAFNTEAGHDDRTEPIFSVILRQVDDEP